MKEHQPCCGWCEGPKCRNTNCPCHRELAIGINEEVGHKTFEVPKEAQPEWEESWMTEEVECLWETDVFKEVVQGNRKATKLEQVWMKEAIAHLAHNFADKSVAHHNQSLKEKILGLDIYGCDGLEVRDDILKLLE